MKRKLEFYFSRKGMCYLAFVALWCGLLGEARGQTLRHPEPGDVFKDHKLVNPGNTWRVTDPNATNERAILTLPNQVYGIPVEDLQGAIRAELIIDYWGGHSGTDKRQVRFNGNAWLDIPDIVTGTPNPNCYLQMVNFVVDVPLSNLVQGTNLLEGLAGPQICYGFNWGMWGMYGAVLRVYYDPEAKDHPTGGITSPRSGDTVGEEPWVRVNASSTVGVASVDIFAHYNGFDPDGDGKFLDWNMGYREGAKLLEHVGTDRTSPFAQIWRTNLVPDQAAGTIKFKAHITDNSGYTFVTDEVSEVTLLREGVSVRMYRSSGSPENFIVRDHVTEEVYFTIPEDDDLSKIEGAALIMRTWNGLDHHGIRKLNDFTFPLFGKDHRPSIDKLPVGDGSALKNGLNVLSLYSAEEEEHGMDVLWPGPVLIARYNTDPRAPTKFPGMFGFEAEEGDAIVDSTNNGNGRRIIGDVSRTSNGRFGNGLSFDGTSGYADLGVINFSGDEFTLSMWAHVAADTDPFARLFAKAIGTNPTEGNVIVSLDNGDGLRFRLATDTGGFSDVVTHNALTLDAWNHIAVTYDGAFMRIYVNGVQRRNGPRTGNVYNGSNVPAWLGDNPGGDRRPFKGRIDEVRLYSIAQTVEQIRVDMETAVTDSDLRAPTIPGNLTAVLTSNSTSRLTWEPSIDEISVDRYRIFRNGIEIDKTNSAVYEDTFLLPNRTYTYTVSAVDFQGNESPLSNGSNVTTPPDLQPPTTPRNLSVTASSYRANLSWAASIDDTGIASYKIFRNGKEVASANNTFYSDNGLEVQTTYVYQVMAVDYIGNFSGLSEQIVVTTLPEPRNPSLFLGLPFEQESGSIAVDSSGYRNDGIISGGVRRSDEGYFGDALDFGGGGGLVDLGKLDIPGSETTIAAWVKADDFGIRDARIISKAIGSADNQHYWMISTIPSNGGIKLRGRFKTNAGATRTLLGATDLVAGEWMHVAMVYDGSFIRLYLNGVLDSELEHGGEIAQNANVPVAIGNQPQGGRGFDGLIDEVKIYSVAYDAEGIAALMNEKLPGPGGANLPPEISDIADQTLSGGETLPTIPFSIDDVGTPVEELVLTVASNNSNLLPTSAIALAGTGASRSVTLTPIEGVTGSAKVTLTVSDGEAEAKESFTLRVVTPGNTPPVISDIPNQSMEQGDVIEGIAFTLFDAGTAAEDLGLTVATENPKLIPLEGLVLGGSGSERTLSIAPAPGFSGKTTILLTVDDGEYFVEQQIEVEISPPFETSLWLGLPFEEEFGTIAFDISEHRNEGVLGGTIERIAEGQLGRALRFSGDGESVDLGSLDIFGSQMTIAAWIRPDDLNAPGDRIISKATGEQEDKHFWMLSTHRTNQGTKLRARLKTSSGGTETLVGSTNLLQGEWIHVAATYDGAELKLFLNGQEDGSLFMNGQIAENSTVPAAIGNQPQGGNNFVGLIDEVRIYSQALNSSQLQSIMTEHLVPPNVAPIISEISAENIPVNSASSIPFTVADAETAPFLLEVSATSSNPTLIPNSGLVVGGAGNNRTLTITPTANRSGNAQITVTVDDGERMTSQTFSVVVVTPGNTKPTISAIGDVSIIADSSTGPIPFSIDDALTDPANLALTAESDDPDFVPPSAITFAGSGSNRTIEIRPVAGARGPATITVRVSDGEFEVEETFELSLYTPVHPDLWLGLPFEEEEGSAVVDISLYGNDGSLTAGVSRAVSTERGGNLVFSGRGGHVNLGPLDIPSSRVTLAAWIRPDYYGIPDGRIISKATGLTDNQHFWMISTIDVEDETRIRVRFNTSTGVGTLVGESDIPVGEWTHVAATYDGAAIRLYIDGSLDGELPWSGSMTQDPNVLAAIGDQPQGGRNFDGLIDDVRIYTRALADAEVGTIMNGVLPVPNAPPTISSIPNQTVLVDNATDEIVFAVGDVKTSPYQLDVTAVSDNSILVPQQGIELGHSGGARYVKITPRAGETGNAWITLSVSDGEFTVEESFLVAVVTPGNSAPTISEILDLKIIPDSTTGPVTFTIGDTDTDISQLSVSATSDNATLLPPENIATGGSGSTRSVTLTPAPGRNGEAVVSVSVHDGELTTVENFTLRVEAAVHPSLIVGLPFEESEGDTVFDISANKNNGQLTSGAKRSELGYNGNSVVFSGNGGHVNLGKIDIPGSAMTLAAWVNPDDYGVSDARIISKASGTSDNEHYWMISTTAVDGEIRLRLRLKTSDGNTKTLVGTTNLLTLEDWYHVAATYDGEYMRLFIDGVVDAELPAVGKIIQNSNVSAALGDQPQGGNNFDGRIDDLRIFSIALSSSELQDLMAGVLEVPNTGPSISEIADQNVFRDAVTDPIRFTIEDVETTGYLLEVSASSDDATLLPPQGITLAGAGPTRELILRPQTGLTGIVNVTVRVSDGEFEASETFVLRVVTPGNKPPSINPFEDIVIDFGGSSDPIPFSVADSETASADLLVTARSDNDVLVPADSIVLGGSGASRTMTITPAAIQGATSVITVTVSDGELISSESFEVTVNPPFDESLLLGYPFEGTSATVFDISPNLNNGTMRGDAERVLGGKYGRALRLSGRGGQIDLHSMDIPGSRMTIATWIKADDFGIQDARIVSKASGEGINDHYWMISSSPVRGTDRLRMRLKTRNGVTNTLIGSTPLEEGVWTHIAVTFDGSLLRLFVNGVEDGLLPLNGEIAQDAGVAAAIGDQPDGQHNFDGLIDDFRIYTQALSAIEIQEIMATPLVDVGYLNHAPALSAIPDQEIYAGSRTGEIDIAVSDVETPAESLVVSVESNNQLLVPSSSLVMSGTGAARTLVVSPTVGTYGQAIVTVTVDDGEAQTSESFRLTVKDAKGRGGWWNAAWAYRMPLSVSANGVDRRDAIAELPVDLTAALDEIATVEAVDISTLRLVEVDSSDLILDDQVPFQFDPSAEFDATTNATGNLILKLEGATPGDAIRYYHLYFAPAGSEAFAWEPEVEVRVRDDVIDEGQISVRVDTLEGSLYYHKLGAGFSSWDDKDGIDWIDYHPTGGSSGNYRGIPNMVFPEGYFHPSSEASSTTVVHEGPLKATLHSRSLDGKWESQWEFFGSHVRMTVLKADHSYWFLYEGTPGGVLDGNDVVVRSDGESVTANQSLKGDVVGGDEWYFIADADQARSIYFALHETDGAFDTYQDLDGRMTVLAFGRNGLGVNPELNGTPKRFTMGLVDQTEYGPMREAIESSYKDFGYETRTVEIASDANNAPLVEIAPLGNGAEFGEGDLIALQATALDLEDGDVTASIVWSSTLDGLISGAGGSASTNTLSVGTHEIRATATDSLGYSWYDSVEVVVHPNQEPRVTIASPLDEAFFLAGEEIVFTGSATDPEDGDVTSSLKWVSDIDAGESFGATVSTSNLSVGVHTITATAVDTHDLVGSNSITVTVADSSSRPVVSIDSPTAAAGFDEGSPVVFAATAIDAEDGDLSSGVAWKSNIDGNLGTGRTISVDDLTAGIHTITATVSDSGLLPGSSSISVTIRGVSALPVVDIRSPEGGLFFTEDQTVVFSARATDAEDGELTPQIEWISSLDGVINEIGGDFATSDLSVGQHVITAQVTDAGYQVGSDSIELTISGISQPANVSILSPEEISFVKEGDQVVFSAVASDPEDGDLSGSIVWTSNLDGWMGEGGTVSAATLSKGLHTVTAAVLDSGFQRSSDSVTIGVGSDSQPPQVSIFAPLEGARFNERRRIDFVATAQDPEDGDVTDTISWRSNIDGPLGASGGELSISTLSVGVHTVTATAIDSGFEPGSASVTFMVREVSLPPTVVIEQPASGSVFTLGDRIDFLANASDKEDGDVSSGIEWYSNIDGRIGTTGSSISLDSLSVGVHTITAKAFDSGLLDGSAEIELIVRSESGLPVVELFSPEEGEFFAVGDIVSLEAIATDPEDGDITSTIVWKSDLDGRIEGQGGLVSTTKLSVGVHTITATALDSGFQPGSSSRRVAVSAESDAPVVVINDPLDGAQFYQGEAIEFVATAQDADDGDVSESVTWTSSIDGELEERGGTVSISDLSVGNHVITATGVDSGFLPGFAKVEITVRRDTALPQVTIRRPTAGAVYEQGSVINLEAVAIDAEDGDISSGIRWHSSLDGPFDETGRRFSTPALSPGIHTVTASVLDSGLQLGEASVTFEIEPLVGQLLSDDFSGDGLDEGIWQVVDPVGDAIISTDGGSLRIHLPAGSDHDIWTDGNRTTRLMQDIHDTDFEFEARFTSDMTGPYQMQGFQIEQDSENYLRFDFVRFPSSVRLFSASFVGEVPTTRIATDLPIADEYYIRVRRFGDRWTLSYSLDGDLWNVGGSYTYPITATRAGIYAGNASGANAPEFNLEVDYVVNKTIPIFYPDSQLEVVVSGEGTVTVDPVKTYYESGERIELKAEPAPGWKFNGWAGDVDSKSNPLRMEIEEDLEILALFLPSDGRSIIDVWYGDHQTFGRLGVPQAQINILGNVIIPEQIESLTYSLNGVHVLEELTMDPEQNVRIGRKGDFNVEIPFTDLNEGENLVEIKAIGINGTEYTEEITVDSSIYNVWPRPFAIDWSLVSRIDEVGQVVDGKWELVAGGVRAVESHYDRLIAIGDIDWTDYEVTVPITVHHIDHQPPPHEPLVGVMLRWDGHERIGFEQPGTEWRPIGAMGVHGWYLEGPRGGHHFQIFETGRKKYGGYNGISMEVDKTYYFKFRVETPENDATFGLYSLKIWAAGDPEPNAWGIVRQAEEGLLRGSFMLVAHYVEATFGNVLVSSLEGNDPPTIEISGPDPDGEYVENVPISFTATAIDADDGDISSSIKWSSSIDGPLNVVGGNVEAGLSLGEHVITASIVDSDSSPAVASMVLTVTPNTEPSVSILSPSAGSQLFEGVPVTLRATAEDPYDGVITDSIVWSSSIDGSIAGQGGAVTTSSLSIGTHVLTATATDRGGLQRSTTLTLEVLVNPNDPPQVVIQTPVHNSAHPEGDPVELLGRSTDREDGDLSEQLTWRSSIDGEIGSGRSFVLTDLSVGTHEIEAFSTDSGLLTRSTKVSVTIVKNASPLVSISKPETNANYTLGDTVSFRASSFDAEDGDLTSDILWSSSIDGDLPYTGPTFSTDMLSPGKHTIVAKTVDSKGLEGSTEIKVVVNTPAGPVGSDDFVGPELDTTQWTFVDPQGDSSYSLEGGELIISLPGGSDHDVWIGGNRSARMLQRIDNTDFSFYTKFGTTPSEKFQSQGILVEQDSGNFIRYDIYSNGKGVFIFGAFFSNGIPDILFNTRIGESTAYFMRVSRERDVFTLEYSFDGFNWIQGISFKQRLDVENIGIYAGNASGRNSPAFTMSADYVFNTEFPIVPEDEGGPNATPTVTIAEPAHGASFKQGETVTLRATAQDAENGNLTGLLGWSSDIDGAIQGNGGVVSVSDLSPGIHVLTASATDLDFTTGTRSVAIEVIPNDSPVVAIAQPAEGSLYFTGETISLSAEASDSLDGDLSASIEWSSDIDGVFATGATVDVSSLSAGVHLIRAAVADSNGAVGEDTVSLTNRVASNAPVVSVLSPNDAEAFIESDPITLTASALDTEDGDLSSEVTWESSIDGALPESGASVTTSTLSVGVHLLTARVVDSGFLAGSATVTVEVKQNNQPEVVIGVPTNRSIYTLGDTINFTGTASDVEDGVLNDQIVWISSIDGQIGTVGAGFSTDALSPGNHIITASATDSHGLEGSTSIELVVLTPAGPIESDDFAGEDVDKTLWSFVDPVGDSSYRVRDGVLTISIPGGTDHDLWSDGNRGARMVQRIVDEDFGIEAKFGSRPTEQFQNQGILIEQDDENFIRFDFYSNGSLLYIFVANFYDLDPRILLNRPIVATSDAIYMRVERDAGVFTLSYSFDGEAWVEARTVIRRMVVNNVGVYAGNSTGSSSPAFTAAIDYVFNTASPILDQDEGGVNAAPTVTIQQPAAGANVPLGELLTLTATAIDAEDGDVSHTLAWTSNVDGPLEGTGGTVSTSALTPGDHIIEAVANDTSGVEGKQSIAITVNALPEVTISGPAEGAVFIEGDTITLSATATDLNDGNLNSSVKWWSDIDGPISGSGSTVSVSTLSVGTHVLEARVTDSGGLTGKAYVSIVVDPNQEPVVVITSPANEASFPEEGVIRFTAIASDEEDGDLTDSVIWSSNVDGVLGVFGGDLSVSNLSSGTHLITATAVDSGFQAGSSSIILTVIGNKAPLVLITSPLQRSIFNLGDSIQFKAVATDVEDGDLTSEISWISSLDGPLAPTGGIVNFDTLLAGEHYIFASVFDSDEVIGSDITSIVVEPPVAEFISDDFVGDTLDRSYWKPVDAVGDGTIEQSGGSLKLSVSEGKDHDLWVDGNRSLRVVQRVPDSDFSLEAKFLSTPTRQFQSQGILIEQDDTNFTRFDIYSNGKSLFVFCATFQNGEPEILFNQRIEAEDAYFLRTRRVGDFFVYEYSNDGDTWFEFGSGYNSLLVKQLGVYAGNASGANSPAFTAEIDHVFNTNSPVSPED
ncbi:DUF1349 domain-containing protein [Pelagicoccus sp. NFK12]|uniref:DUF1349 domain-containing protein n=1 Tax=Pelagicoccus enzymogenes TaxID=2773457 RepID=A0A927FBA5_9BACT|nr:LamG-like jellyroll fold domain-containing protein [Pelagicoccus enzymogenes]MBD5781196.1 DUF1349 domain-containing protein [Pelagicoccus enzymogenes]